MEKEMKETLMGHIKQGTFLPNRLFDIQGLLANAGMKLYAKPCCDRIEAAGLVDGIHIFHKAPSLWNLQVDFYGLGLCKAILAGYLKTEYLNSVQELLQSCQDWGVSCNNILYSLRKMSSDDLKNCRTEAFVYEVPEGDMQDISELFNAELKSRNIPGRLIKIKNRIIFTARMLRLFPGPKQILWSFVKEKWDSWDKIECGLHFEGNGRYAKALRRFLDRHGGVKKANRLQGDELAKYIFLAVKAYGKEYPAEVNHIRASKSCLEIEGRYQGLKQVMEAVGKLAPIDLMRLYPVEKVYDGRKWGSKDYYFTMDKIKGLPPNEPIGNVQDVACLLWDYQNWDLEFLLMQWMNVIGDLYIYCNEPGPNGQFHDRMMKDKA